MYVAKQDPCSENIRPIRNAIKFNQTYLSAQNIATTAGVMKNDCCKP